jgi:hypothetical protein
MFEGSDERVNWEKKSFSAISQNSQFLCTEVPLDTAKGSRLQRRYVNDPEDVARKLIGGDACEIIRWKPSR